MPIQNAYNPNPTTVDGLFRKRQAQADLQRDSGSVPVEMDQPKQENPRFLGVEQTPDSVGKSFGRKVLEDAALLSYAIPVGVSQALTSPLKFASEMPGAIVQSVKDVADVGYYKAHPLLGAVNAFGFISPIAGFAKSAAIKTAMRTAITTGVKEGVGLGVQESVLRSALSTGMREAGGLILKKGPLGSAVWEAAKTGKVELVTETVKALLGKSGVADDVALRVASQISDNLYTSFSRSTTKMKALEALSHPVGSAYGYVAEKADPIRRALFGDSAKTAVASLYGAETVAKNPEGFVAIERWADAQLKEQGLASNMANRQRIMQNWVDQNPQWASLTPEQRVSHFKNYAEQDLHRLAIHNATGMDVVTTKSLPQNYVDAMVQTVKDAPKDLDAPKLIALMEDAYGNDFANHSAEIKAALAKGGDPREVMIAAVSKLGNARATISFAKFSPEVQELAAQLEKTGYRIGRAPKNKPVSFVTDTMKAAEGNGATIPVSDALVKRTAFGNWLDKIGLSPKGTIEGAAEFAYRENFTQGILGKFAEKYGDIIKLKSIKSSGMTSIPVERLYEWLDKNRAFIQESRKKVTLPIRTIFDLNEDDLIRVGLTKEMAVDILDLSKRSLSDVPASVTGMGDKLVNFLRTRNKGYNAWMSRWYDEYLKIAYKGRYDLSPFFSAQEFVETKLNSALFLKDPRRVAGAAAAVSGAGLGFGAGALVGGAVGGPVGAVVGGGLGMVGGQVVSKLGNWTAESLAKYIGGNTSSYLREIIDKPPINEVAAIRDEILGTLQKTMLDYTSSPDIIGVQSAAQGIKGLAGEAAFERSIKSRNLWYGLTGQSSVRMATTFNKALASKFGMTLEQALDFTMENGAKKYKNPQMVQMMRESTQQVFHYKPGLLTSPLIKTMNLVWFPLRFEAKSVSLVSKWMSSLSPANRLVVMNNWVNFANWAGTDEGVQWRRTNRNMLYNIFSYVTAYEQMGQGLEAVSKGRLFGGNAGLIGAIPFGFVANLARELAILPEDEDQFDPKTGRRFTKEIPRKLVSAATFTNAVEQLLISISPSTPFYSLTGGMISGVSPRKIYESLVRQVVGAGKAKIEGKNPDKGRQLLEREFKRVPLDYSRLTQ